MKISNFPAFRGWLMKYMQRALERKFLRMSSFLK